MVNNNNHPKKGSRIKVEPIRDKAAIRQIKAILLQTGRYRDHCLFTLGLNTAFRANELLSLTINQVAHLGAGDDLEIKQSKNKKYRMVTLNKTAVEAIQLYLTKDPAIPNIIKHTGQKQPLFYSQRGECLKVPTVNNLLKSWCGQVNLKGNYGSHTMRKSWGYWQYKRGKPIPLLMVAFGHATQQQTLAYLCILADDVREIYDMEL